MKFYKKNDYIVIIGGGYSGLATGVLLQDKGIRVKIFESSPYLGGRSRQVKTNHFDANIDNGQHILLGAYKTFLDILKIIQPHKKQDDLFYIQPMCLNIPNVLEFKANQFNDLVTALVSAKGLTWQEKLQFGKLFFTCRQLHENSKNLNLHSETVRNWLNHLDNLSDKLKKFIFEPLCVASMNTPPDQANAQIFLNILRDSLFTFRSFKTSLMLIPKINLTELFSTPCRDFIENRGGEILTNSPIKHLSEFNLDQQIVVSAVSPYRLKSLIENIYEFKEIYNIIDNLNYEAITTIYIQFNTSLKSLNFNDVIIMLPILKDYGWWLINKEITSSQIGLLAVVLSAVDPHSKKNINDIIKVINNYFNNISLENVKNHIVITEKRATLRCDSNIKRPFYKTSHDNFYLTGDYIDDDYSATIETAMRNAKKVADHIVTRYF